jgi:hypothetical protein
MTCRGASAIVAALRMGGAVSSIPVLVRLFIRSPRRRDMSNMRKNVIATNYFCA